MFQINDKVVCLDDSEWRYDAPPLPPKKGGVYVVEFVVPRGITGQRPASHLPPTNYCVMLVGMPDGAWHPERFRKLSEIQADNAARRSVTTKVSYGR
jgi:hypothetical protein